MFYIAYSAILWLGMMVANGCSTFIIHLDGMGRPAAHMLRSMCIALGVYSVVVGLPFIFLWRTYKKAILRFVSAQDEVLVADSAAMRQRRIRTRSVRVGAVGVSIRAATPDSSRIVGKQEVIWFLPICS